MAKFLGAIDCYVYAWYGYKIFFHQFHFFAPPEPSKVKNHAQNSLFRGVKNQGFGRDFWLSRARRVAKNENDEKIFSKHVRHTHSYRFHPNNRPSGIGEQNGRHFKSVTPPSGWDFNNYLHITPPLALTPPWNFLEILANNLTPFSFSRRKKRFFGRFTRGKCVLKWSLGGGKKVTL